MPQLSGPEVIAELRARDATRTLPIILVTGLSEPEERVAGLEAGADDYITKPVHLDELVARVRTNLRAHAAWASLLATELQERAEVAAALTQLRPEATVELTALRICEELSRLRGLPLVAILRATSEDGLVPLAVHAPYGMAWRVGHPLREAESRRLLKRARQGPWISSGRAGDWYHQGLPDLTELGIGGTVQAPLMSRDDMIAVLVVGVRETAARTVEDELARELPAAIDFAAIASALLAPALDSQLEATNARARLETVIEQRLFSPHFQPIFELHGGRIVAYEALTRFHDGTPPEIRFAEATRLGLGTALETACLEEAVEASVSLPHGTWLSLNVSPSLVLEGKVLPELLERTDRLVLVELTEHDPVEDYGKLRDALARLGDRARVSVDDAGSGYSSLQHILALRPSFVKLDSAWVSGLQHDPARQALVAGLSYFAFQTGCELIAEGVETADERAALDQLAVRLGQGFLLGQPQAVA